MDQKLDQTRNFIDGRLGGMHTLEAMTEIKMITITTKPTETETAR